MPGFDLNGQNVFKSCGVTHENNIFIYGGDKWSNTERQVLQLINCTLSLVGNITFGHNWGACDSSNGLIVLCFDNEHTKQCRQATKPLGPWNDMTPSTYDHHVTMIDMSPGSLVDIDTLTEPFFNLSRLLGSRLEGTSPRQGRALRLRHGRVDNRPRLSVR